MKSVAAVLLAAGASTRLGEPKQLVLLAGERLLDRAVRTAEEAGCSPIIVVLGASGTLIAETCHLQNTRVLHNAAWQEGIASSIRLGVVSIRNEVEAAIVMTCDQPSVTPAHLLRLTELAPKNVVASSYAGRHGVPAFFPASSFNDLLCLAGDFGARDLIASALAVILPGGELDIDAPSALQTARSIYK